MSTAKPYHVRRSLSRVIDSLYLEEELPDDPSKTERKGDDTAEQLKEDCVCNILSKYDECSMDDEGEEHNHHHAKDGKIGQTFPV